MYPPAGTDGIANATGFGCTKSTRSCKTCLELGWSYEWGDAAVCGTSLAGCKALPHDAAAAACAAEGARMCTAAETTRREAQGTGCNLDRESHWTSTPCTLPDGGPGFIQQGDVGAAQFPPTCTAPATAVKFRCCADQAPAFLSHKSCAELRWPLRSDPAKDGCVRACVRACGQPPPLCHNQPAPRYRYPLALL